MNIEDDESHLSAYLDNELDPADRLAVEWAVESSPALADQLRELAQARSVVVHLGRPSIPRDLAPAVVARVVAARRRARLRVLVRPGKVALAASGVLGMAASLILALVLLHESTHEAGQTGLLASWFGPARPARPHPIIAIRIQPRPGPTTTATVLTPSRPDAPASPKVARAVGPAPRGRPAAPAAPIEEFVEAGTRARLVGMMGGDRPVVRALIASDDAGATGRVLALLQGYARKVPDFGRIAIEPGIVVDPNWPEAADVYPVVLDERGCLPFLDRLRASFPGLRVEDEVAVDLLTQLPEVGGVALFRGVEAAPLGEPPVGLQPYIATKDLPPHAGFAGPGVVDATGRRPAEGASRVEAEVAGPPLVGRDDRGYVTVLVWVTRPGR